MSIKQLLFFFRNAEVIITYLGANELLWITYIINLIVAGCYRSPDECRPKL